MAIKGVLRSGFMQLRVLELEKAVDHYVRVIGLTEVCRTEDGRVCLKAYDEFDHHSLILREASETGMDFMGFKVESPEVLADFEQKTKEFGLECESIPANSDQPGFGRRVAVQLPTGHRIDLYAEVELATDIPGINNPNIWQREPHGMGVSCFDHALLYGPNAKEAVRYFTEVLGLSLVEVTKTPDGKENLAVWLSANNKAHDLAILQYDQPGKLHHVAFKLDSWEQIGRAADLISINDIALDAGPMRHGITRGQTIYFFDPSGNRNEVYAGGYSYFPDMPLRVWDFDHVGKGIFYYTRELNDRFLSVVS
jgi:catechol 2,3-dioxygenase